MSSAYFNGLGYNVMKDKGREITGFIIGEPKEIEMMVRFPCIKTINFLAFTLHLIYFYLFPLAFYT